jgi:hypothetical protein
MTRLWTFVLAFFMVLGLERAAHAQLLSPGPLSKAHHSLEGDSHCNDCHSSGKRVDQNACLKCHSDLATRMNAGQGLHGRNYRGQGCQTCHIEHLGSTPTKWPGGGPSSLNHAQTGWPLNGPHNTACNKCHTKTMPASGSVSYLGLSTACNSCHKDQHAGRFGTNCADCHQESAWTALNLGSFNHELANFKLRGAHTSVACNNGKCHGAPPKYTGLTFNACTSCHTDPHAGKLGANCQDCHEDTKWKPVTFKGSNAKHPGISLANGHAPVACGRCHDRGNLAAPSKGSACVSCHRPVHKAPLGNACGNCHGGIVWLGLPRAIGLAAHPKTQYPLTGKHDEVNCAGCHKPTMPREQRYRQLTFAKCLDCHQDKHQGEFQRLASGECKGCHATAGFRPTTFGADEHAQTKFGLVGKHTATPCSGCHTNARPRLDLHVAKQACAECHQNPHGDQFAAQMAKGGCAECHSAMGWHAPKVDHSTWPLTGAHATAACESCHRATDADRKAGHGASYRGVPRACGGCHDDQHLGQFRLSQPILECDACHKTQTFKLPEFDHGKKTKWPLTGAHGSVDCTKCHAQASVNGFQTTRWRTPSNDCKFCHANPHKERTQAKASFADTVACTACHSTSAWKSKDGATGDAKFDHSTTGFPLTGQHSKAACTQCHNATSIKRDCNACHTDFHRGRLSQQCDNCHNSASFHVVKPLEIHRMTRLPLTGMHVLADCTQCHVRASEQRYTDAPIECYACHQRDYERPGIFPHQATATSAALPRDCSMCHRAVAWVPANVPPNFASAAWSSNPQTRAPVEHDLRFPVGFGSHRGAACSDCHASLASPRSVRCVGCHAHAPTTIMQQHKGPTATDGAGCLSCHPAGVRR